VSLELVLVDTSVWIFALRKEPHPSIKQKIDDLLKENLVVTTPPIKLELLGGVNSEKEFEHLKKRLEALQTVGITDAHWTEAAHLAFHLRRRGLTLPYTGVLLSAVAIREEIVLLHADAHFNLIAKHSDLKTKSFIPLLKNRTTVGSNLKNTL
jgi:hypothetical protein